MSKLKRQRKKKNEQNSCTSQQRFTDIGFGVFFFGTATGSATQWIVPMPCLLCAQVQADKVKGMFEQIDLDGSGPASHDSANFRFTPNLGKDVNLGWNSLFHSRSLHGVLHLDLQTRSFHVSGII